MDRKIRVGAVSYLNTKPLLYGIERAPVRNNIELVIGHPAAIADMLLEGQIDLGLVPVAIIPLMEEAYLNGDYCIASDGPVASVCLFSERPLDQIEKVLLDYQSRTSSQLARILLREHWQVRPEIVEGRKDFRNDIRGATAGVVIGDRAFEQRNISPYVYDLGEGWKALTGLPFVFAAWVSNKRLDLPFVTAFNEANRQGLLHIEEVVEENPYHLYDLHDYFTLRLDYHMDARKQLGLEKFLQYIRPIQTHSKKRYFSH